MLDAIGKPVAVGDYVAHTGGKYAGVEGSILRVTKLTSKGISGLTKTTEEFYKKHPTYNRTCITKACQAYTIINITKLLTEEEKF